VLRAVFSRFGSVWGAALMKNLLVGFGLLLLVVPGVIAFIVTFAMVPAVLIEGASTSEAFDRSRALARGQWGRILATQVLGFLPRARRRACAGGLIVSSGSMAGGRLRWGRPSRVRLPRALDIAPAAG